MATYYWVGGPGTWNDTNALNWSLTDGGAGNAGVPTNGDTVYFTALSGTGTVSRTTADDTRIFNSLYSSGASGITFSGSGNIRISGTTSSVFDISGFGSWTSTGIISFESAYGTITFGRTIANPISIIASGTGTVTFTEGFTSTGLFNLTSGYVVFGGTSQTYSIGRFDSSDTSTRRITYGTGCVVNITGTGTVWTTSTATGFSVVGTPTINFTNTSGTARTINNFTGHPTGTTVNVTGGTGTLTLSGTYPILNFTGYSGAIQATSFAVTHSLTLSSGMFFVPGTSTVTVGNTSTSATYTTLNRTATNLSFTGRGVSVTGDLKSSGNISVSFNLSTDLLSMVTAGSVISTSGNFTTSNSTMSFGSGTVNIAGDFTATSGTINFNSSTVTVGGNFTRTSATINAGTSTIIMAGVSTTFAGGSSTFNNVIFASALRTNATRTITGTNTFASLTFSGSDDNGTITYVIPSGVTQTVTNFTTTSADNLKRIFVQSSTPTTTRGNISVSGTKSLAYTTFQGISAIGTAAPFTGTLLDSAGNNSNITTASPRTVYWSTPGGSTTADVWSNTSGGATSPEYFPLRGDTVVLDNNSATTAITAPTFEFVTSQTTLITGTAVAAGTVSAIPAGAKAGDLAVVLVRSYSDFITNFTNRTPTGWTQIQRDTVTGGTSGDITADSYYKILTESDIATNSITVTSSTSGGTSSTNVMTLVFRAQFGIQSLIVTSTGEAISTDPAAQTLTLANAVNNYALGIGHYISTNAPTITTSLSMTSVATNLATMHNANYVIQTSSTADGTIDMNDTGAFNVLQGFDFQITPVRYAAGSVVFDIPYLPTISASTRSTALAVNGRGVGATPTSTGDLTFSSSINPAGFTGVSITGATRTFTFASTTNLPTTVGAGGVLNLDGSGTASGAITLSTSTSTLNVNATGTISTLNMTAGTLSLNANKTITALNLTAGTINLNNNVLSTPGITSGTLDTLAFGTTGAIHLTGNARTIWGLSPTTITGSGIINCTYTGATGIRTITAAASSTSSALTFNITGADAISTASCGSLNFTGFDTAFTGTLQVQARTVYGDLTFSSGMTLEASTNAITTLSRAGTVTLTSVSKIIPFDVATATNVTQINIGSNIQFSGTGNRLIIGGTTTVEGNNFSVNELGTQTAGNPAVTLQNITITNLNHVVGTVRIGTGVGSITSYAHATGTLNLNGNNLTLGSYLSPDAGTRSITFGTNTLSISGSSGTIWDTTTATGWSYAGTPNIVFNAAPVVGTTRALTFGAHTSTTAPNVSVNGGSDTLTLSGSVSNLNLTGFTGTLSNQTRTIYGTTFSFPTGITYSTGTSITTFSATGSATFTPSAATINFPVTLTSTNSSTITIQGSENFTLGSTRALRIETTVVPSTGNFAVGSLTVATGGVLNVTNTVSVTGAVTVSGGTLNITNSTGFTMGGGSALTLSSGTLNITNKSIAAGSLAISGGTLTFGTSGSLAAVNITGTVVSISGVNATGSRFISVASTTTSARTVSITTAGFNLLFGDAPGNAGTCTLNGTFNSINFTNFTGTWANTDLTVASALTLSSGMTVATGSGVLTVASAGTCTLNSAGKTLNNITVTSGTLSLAAALTIDPNRTLTLTAGTINTNGFTLTAGGYTQTSGTLTATGSTVSFTAGAITLTAGTITFDGGSLSGLSFSSNNSNVRTLAFGATGTMSISSTGTVWNTTTITNLSLTGSKTVTFTNTTGTARTMIFGALTEANAPNVAITGGTGTLAISGSIGSFNLTGWVGTLDNGLRTFHGSVTIPTGATLTGGTSTQTFAGTTGGSINSPAALTWDFPVTFSGGSWSTINNFTVAIVRAFTVSGGTFHTANNQLNIGTATLSGGAMNLSASTITCTGNWTNTGTTITAGTSTINMTVASGATFAGFGQTYNNVSFTDTTSTTAHAITGANTFGNLTIAAPASTGTRPVTLSANQTITGTLSASGTASRRFYIRSSVTGTRRTITAAAVTLDGVDFKDIAGAGAAAPFTGTSLSDGGNNTGITFTAAKTVYWNQLAGGKWNDVAWATTSGGTPSADNFPLGQDIAVFDDAGLTTSAGSSIRAASNITYLGSNVSTNSSITIQTGLQAGDIAILVNGVRGTVAGTDPAGWTVAQTNQTGTTIGGTIYYKMLTSGDIGTTITTKTASTDVKNILLYFRPDVPLTSSNAVIVRGASEGTTSNPVVQTLDYTSSIGPSIGVVQYYSNGAVSPRTSSLTMSELNNSTSQYVKYLVQQNSTFTNGTVDMDDEGSNLLQSVVLEFREAGSVFINDSYTLPTIQTTVSTGNMFLLSGTNTPVADNMTLNDRTVVSGSGTWQVIDDVNIVNNGTITVPLSVTAGNTLTLSGSGTTSGTISVANTAVLSLAGTTTVGALSFTTGSTLNLDSGVFVRSISGSPTYNFGTGSINIYGNSGTVWSSSPSTVTGTGTVFFTYSGSVGTRTISANTANQTLNLNVTAGTDIVSISSAPHLSFTGFSGTLADTSRILYGDLTLSSGMTLSSTGTNVTTFVTGSPGADKTITTAGKTIPFPIAVSGGSKLKLLDALTSTSSISLSGPLDLNGYSLTANTGGIIVVGPTDANLYNSSTLGTSTPITQNTGSVFTLQGNLTAGAYTLTGGALNLNGFDLNVNSFSSSNTNSRSIAFGSVSGIAVRGSSAGSGIWDTTIATNFSYTATSTPTINLTATSGTRALTSANLSPSPLNVSVGAGSGGIFLTGTFNNVEFDPSFTGTHPGAFTCAGDLTFAPGGFSPASNTTGITFTKTSEVNINLNGKDVRFPLTLNGSGLIWNISADNILGTTGQTADTAIIVSNGTLNTNNYDLTTYRFVQTGGTVNAGSTAWDIWGAGGLTVWGVTGGTFNIGTSEITLSSDAPNASRTFVGGNIEYNKVTIGGGSATGSVTTFSNTNINELATDKTVAQTIKFTSGQTHTFDMFSAIGSSGNPVTIESTSATAVATLNVGRFAKGVKYFNFARVGLSGSANRLVLPSTSTAIDSNNVFVKDSNGNHVVVLSGAIAGFELPYTIPYDWNPNNNEVHLIGKGANGTLSTTDTGTGGGGGAYAKVVNAKFRRGREILISRGSSTGVPTYVGGWYGTVSVTDDVMTVSASTYGRLEIGSTIIGVGVEAGTKVTEYLTGRGGVGTYRVSITHLTPVTDVLANGYVGSAAGASGATGGLASASIGDVTYNGGTAGSVVSGAGFGRSGGGGAAGPNGAGGNSGSGTSFAPGTGGGGANGGSSSANITGTSGTAGGNNRLGTGGGAGGVINSTAAQAGTSGGGGGGGATGGSNIGGANGSNEVLWAGYGPGGGGGGGAATSLNGAGRGGDGGYGAGGGGGHTTSAGTGGNGLIALVYKPLPQMGQFVQFFM